MNIRLDNKTVLVNGSVSNILNRVNRTGRKGVDMRLFTVNSSEATSNVDRQTVVTFLSSMKNPNKIDQKSKEDVDALIGEALDRVLISDRVRSASDYFTTNYKKDMTLSNTLVVE